MDDSDVKEANNAADKFEAMHGNGTIWITTIAAAQLARSSNPPTAQINQALVKALEQITNVYQSMRETLNEKYPQDGWSAETMTLDKAKAVLTAAKEQA